MRRLDSLAAVVLAALLLSGCARPPEEAAALLPALAPAAERLDRIQLAQGDEEMVFVRREGRWWIEDAEWPVARAWLDPLLLGLLDARCDEPRTARAEHFGQLGLAWPAESDPAAVGGAFARPTGRLSLHLAAAPTHLVLGYPHPRGGGFVRVEGAASSCLTHTDLRLPATPAEWWEPALLDAPWQTLAALGMADGAEAPVWLDEDEDDAALAAASGLRQIGIRPVRWPLPPAQRRLYLQTPDGRRLMIELRGTPEATWARVDEPSLRYAGREFRLPHDVAATLWLPLPADGVRS